MTTIAPAKKRVVIAETVQGPLWRGPADIRLIGRRLSVTLELPQHEPGDLQWQVTGDTLIVRCRNRTRPLHLVIPLEPRVRSDRFVVCTTRSVYDVRMERA